MAFPTIVFNNSTGSDTAASGAGPATALTGTAASYAGSVVTLDGSPDLTNVATDGSHVLYLVTSTGRKFFTINAKDNTAKTVTVDDAPAGTASGLSWAIGGKRSTVHDTNSKYLFTNDAKKNWVAELQYTGTDYTVNNAQFTFGSGGDGDGDEMGFSVIGTGASKPTWVLDYASTSRNINTCTYCRLENIIFKMTYNDDYASGIGLGAASQMIDCEMYSTQNKGYYFVVILANTNNHRFVGNYFHDFATGAAGVAILGGDQYDGSYFGFNTFEDVTMGIGLKTSYTKGCVIEFNVFQNCTDGVKHESPYSGDIGAVYSHNTFRGCGDGIEFGNIIDARGMTLIGNLFTHNTGYGINAPTGAMALWIERYNRFYNNTSGDMANSNTLHSTSSTGTDPVYTNAASFDLSIGTALKGQGGYGGVARSGSTGYLDPGAIQRQEPAGGGGGLIVHPGMGGGFRG